MSLLNRLILLSLLCVGVASAGNLVLITDSAKVEANSSVVARLRAEALSAQKKKTGKAAPLNGEYAEALEMSLSDLRVALPEVIAAIAKAKAADVVLEPEVAKKFALTGVDITAEVTKAIDARSAKIRFLAP
jgi:Skp family chaperone for outer membrane proteins